MAKTKIEFTYEGKEYTLEYTAETLKKLERSGFNFDNIGSHVLTATEDIFYGAFEANHKKTSFTVRKEIWEDISSEDEGGEELSEVLFTMIREAMEALKPQGNTKWKKTT